MRTICTIAVLTLAAAQAAQAHGVWVAQRFGEPAVVYGHAASDDPYDAAKLVSVKAINAEGEVLDVETTNDGAHVTLDVADAAAALIVEFDNGFWTERAGGEWVNRPKSSVEDAEQAGHYVKHNVTLLHEGETVPELPAQALQIVPLSNPIGGEAGDELRVRVLFEGEPLAGAEIVSDYVNLSDAPPVIADESGEAVIDLRNDGLNVIGASHEVALDGNPDADVRGHFATLSFVLHAHEE